jgi:tRNA A-37 threonylcarbamoyl transferase component Bud32
MSDELFGPYRLEKLLGRGGMGEVYRAYHTGQERVVALKLLLPALSDDAVFRRRFLRESRLAARLTDPHVIPVHGWGEVDGRLYLDMRFIEGEDLAALLSRCGALPPARAVEIVEQIARALDAAHGIDLIHRDVKPSNVLLVASGATDTFAYLADFGIARLTHSTGTNGLTSEGAPVGTLAYMAPERFMGEPVDPTTDVYSLACVLHECLTGRRPFEADEPIALISAHLHAEPPRPSRNNLGVPAALDRVVAVGMAKDPALRYRSAGALATAARAAVSAQPPPIPEELDSVTATEQGDPPPPWPGPPTASGPPTRRRARWPLPVMAVLVAVGVVAGVLLMNPVAGGPVVVPLPSTSPDPALSAADRALLMALPSGFASAGCVADPARPAEATAGLHCGSGPDGALGSAEFLRFGDAATLDRFVAADAVRRHLPLDTGNCRNGDDVQTTWSKNGQIAGLLVCYAEPDRARSLRWTDRRTLAMGVVTRADGNSAALYDWWTRYDFGG